MEYIRRGRSVASEVLVLIVGDEKRLGSSTAHFVYSRFLRVLTLPSALMTGSLPFLLDLRSAFASSRPTGSFAVTISFVIT